MATPSAAQMALVPVPNNRLVLVDAPAHVPGLLLVGAGVPLPAGVRAVAAVNRRVGSAIAHAQSTTGSLGPALRTHGLYPVLLGGPGYAAASAHSTPRQGNVRAHAKETLRSARLFGGTSYAAAGTGRARGHGSSFTAMALGPGTGSGAAVAVGKADSEATRASYNVSEILRMRTRLKVFLDKVPMTCRPDMRAVINKIDGMDLAAPVYHWVEPRLQAELREGLGEEVYSWTLKWDIQLDKLNVTQRCLIDVGAKIFDVMKSLRAQITYTIMHADERKAMLPFDHPLYDSTPDFLRTVCTIEAKLHENLDLLCFTHKPPVTSQQLAANHAKVLLLLFEALVNYRVLVNPVIDADSRELGCECNPAALLKELKKQYTMLLAEECKMIDYLKGPCEKQTNMVHNSLQKLKTDMRPLRLCDY